MLLSGDGLQALSLSTEQRLDSVCVRFEAGWQEGTSPRLEDFLGEVPEADRPALLRELLRLELHYRWLASAPPSASEYLDRFPCERTLIEEELNRAQRERSAPELPTIPGHELLRELGRGGMGIVYLARHQALKRTVALKMIRWGNQADAQEHARFRAEAEAIARLQHPNIVQVFEVGCQEGQPYFSMEYCAGGTLETRLAGTPLPVPEAVQLGETLARAVHAAHRGGVVHRDLKPANVLLSGEGRGVRDERSQESREEPSSPHSPLAPHHSSLIPKITDFGLAKKLDETGLTAEDAVIGTPSYMAPEQAAGRSKDVGEAADVYALGAILYECLTGRPPFKAATSLETLWQVLHNDPAPIRQLNHAVPRDLESICLKCLEKEPRRRYATAGELAEDLQHFQNGEPILARPASALSRAIRWAQRRPALAALIAVSILAFILVSWQLAAVVQAHRETDSLRREAERSLTRSHLERGLALLHQGDTAQGMLRLAHALPRVREEWFAPEEASQLRQAIRANLAAWRGRTHALEHCCTHPGPVRSAFFSPDGRSLLTLNSEGQAHLCDLTDPDSRWRRLLGEQHNQEVLCVRFHPDGRLLLLTRQADGGARLWTEKQPRQGQFRAVELSFPGSIQAADLSSDGRLLAVGGPRGLRVFDAAQSRPLFDLLGWVEGVDVLAFSPRGDRLAGSEDRAVRVWDLATPGGTFRKPLWARIAHRYAVRALAFGRDGLLASGSEDHTACLWDASSGSPVSPPLDHQDTVRALCFSGDGKRLLVGGADGAATLWTVSTSRRLGPVLEHRDAVWTVAFSPDSRTALTGTRDGTLRLWRPAAEAQPFREFGTPASAEPTADEVMTAVLSPDPAHPLLITGGSRGSVRAWHPGTGELLFPRSGDGASRAVHTDDVWATAFSSDGRLFATGSRDERVRIWDARRLEFVQTLDRWDNPTGEPTLAGARRRVRALAFGPRSGEDQSGHLLLVGGGGGPQGKAVLWELSSSGEAIRGQVLHEGSPVWQLAFSARDSILGLASGDGSVTLWKWDGTRASLLGPEIRHPRRVTALAFSPDGRQLLAGGIDGAAQLWEVKSGRPLGKPFRHPGAVWAAAFLNEHTVATGCRDGGARLWDVPTGLAIGPPLRHAGVVWALTCASNGELLVTGSEDGTTRAWQMSPPLEIRDEHLPLWAEVLTGLEMDEGGTEQILDVPTWLKRRRQLALALEK